MYHTVDNIHLLHQVAGGYYMRLYITGEIVLPEQYYLICFLANNKKILNTNRQNDVLTIVIYVPEFDQLPKPCESFKRAETRWSTVSISFTVPYLLCA